MSPQDTHAGGSGAPSVSESPFDDNAAIDSNYSDSESVSLDEDVDVKKKSKRPPENNFTQQRLKAVNPVFTIATVIPMFFAFAVIFMPIGGAMWLASHRIEDVMIDYSYCETNASLDYWSPVPDEYVRYRYKGLPDVKTAQWKLDVDETQPFEDQRQVCRIQFHIPHQVKGPIYLFYHLENFYQNHRRYAKSFSEDQIQGKAASISDIENAVGINCQPLSVNEDGVPYYPCGLIANSMFNDTFVLTLEAVNGTDSSYEMTSEGISWSTNKNRYKKTEYDWQNIAPPPNWYKSFPDGYNSTNVPDISTWEEFQNWMYTSAFPDFYKLALKNLNDPLEEGIYEVTIGLHFPVLPYNGRKNIFISQRSAVGGKNYFMGYLWMVGGAVCFLMAFVLLAVNMWRPRKSGDANLLSWNKEKFAQDEQVSEE